MSTSAAPHRREEALGQDRHLLAVGLAPLDELDEARARRGRERDVGPGRLDGPGVGARRHGAHRADHADAARPGGLDEGSRAGLDHLEHGDRQLGRQLVETGRGRRVAGHDHGLGLEVLDQAPGQLAGEDLDLGLGPGPVRVAAGVADVDEVLGRQQVEHGPGDGQAPEAGVEHPDGPIHRRQATERPAPGPATPAAARDVVPAGGPARTPERVGPSVAADDRGRAAPTGQPPLGLRPLPGVRGGGDRGLHPAVGHRVGVLPRPGLQGRHRRRRTAHAGPRRRPARAERALVPAGRPAAASSRSSCSSWPP